MKRILTCIAMLFYVMAVHADESLKIKFRSRALLDATLSGYGKENTQGYYRVEDLRVGFKATYFQYELKADIGLGGGKVAIKDLLFQYHFKNSILSFGNGYEAYSMDMLISTVDLRFHQSASSVLAFTNSRKLGVTYHFYTPACYLSTGVYTHNDINKIGSDQKNAFVSTTRVVWRRTHNNRLFHFGGAFSFRSKEVNKDVDPVGSVSSDGVTSMFPFPLLKTNIDQVGTELKEVFEALYTAPHFMFQAEYFLNRFNRTIGESYRPHGGYIQGGYLLKGRGFAYDSMYGIPGRPLTPCAIELVARFNYTNLNDTHAGIFGGEEADFSLGVNFYLNKYFGVKLNGSYVLVGDHCNSFYSKNLFLGQIRMQYIF